MLLYKADNQLIRLADAIRWEELWAQFLDWELRVEAFDFLEDGIPLWEYLRVPVFLRLQQVCGFMTSSLSSFPKRLFQLSFWKNLASAATSANPYLAPARPLLCVSIARRIWYRGVWQDPYFEPFLDKLNGTYVYLERPEGGQQVQPAKRPRVYRTDWLALAAAGARRGGWCVSKRTGQWLQFLEEELARELGYSLPVVRLGQQYLAARRCLRWLYERLLKRLRPRVCIIVAINPAERALVEICRDLDIVTAELQHGMIGPYDLTYTTPPGIAQRTFPDYLLTFGPFWRHQMQLPVPRTKSIDVGFPLFQEIVENWEHTVRQPRVLVLAQPGYAEALGAWAIRLARAATPPYRVAFRPHPAEALSPELSQQLQKHGVEVLDGTSSLYNSLASSIIQVGVFSTALYEGLAFGLKTYVAPLPGYQYMRPLLQRGWVRLLEDERQAFEENVAWPRCDARELFLFEGTRPFLRWLNQVLAG